MIALPPQISCTIRFDCVPERSDQCADRGRRRNRRLKMKNFTIENETNNIMIHGSAKEAEAVPNSERFSNEAALAKMAANWAAARLVEIWNSLPGETPVKKFKDRATAVSRIWKAIQGLGHSAPAPAEEPATAPEVAPAPEQEASETVQPEAAIPATTESAPAAPVAPQYVSSTAVTQIKFDCDTTSSRSVRQTSAKRGV
jgi:hypothetical protein